MYILEHSINIEILLVIHVGPYNLSLPGNTFYDDEEGSAQETFLNVFKSSNPPVFDVKTVSTLENGEP